jgi:ribosomal protein L40E
VTYYDDRKDKLCRKCGADYSREPWLVGLTKPTVGDVLIHAWKQLAYGCEKHPRYRASAVDDKVPTCRKCADLFNLRREIESLEIAKAQEHRAEAIAMRISAQERTRQLEDYANSHQ